MRQYEIESMRFVSWLYFILRSYYSLSLSTISLARSPAYLQKERKHSRTNDFDFWQWKTLTLLNESIFLITDITKFSHCKETSMVTFTFNSILCSVFCIRIQGIHCEKKRETSQKCLQNKCWFFFVILSFGLNRENWWWGWNTKFREWVELTHSNFRSFHSKDHRSIRLLRYLGHRIQVQYRRRHQGALPEIWITRVVMCPFWWSCSSVKRIEVKLTSVGGDVPWR